MLGRFRLSIQYLSSQWKFSVYRQDDDLKIVRNGWAIRFSNWSKLSFIFELSRSLSFVPYCNWLLFLVHTFCASVCKGDINYKFKFLNVIIYFSVQIFQNLFPIQHEILFVFLFDFERRFSRLQRCQRRRKITLWVFNIRFIFLYNISQFQRNGRACFMWKKYDRLTILLWCIYSRDDDEFYQKNEWNEMLWCIMMSVEMTPATWFFPVSL